MAERRLLKFKDYDAASRYIKKRINRGDFKERLLELKDENLLPLIYYFKGWFDNCDDDLVHEHYIKIIEMIDEEIEDRKILDTI